MGAVKDPAAGSEIIDELTQRFIQLSFEKFKKIEKDAGLFKNLKKLSIEVESIAKKREDIILTQDKIIPGVNSYSNHQERLADLYKVDHVKMNLKDTDTKASGLFPLRRPTQKIEDLRRSLEGSEMTAGVVTIGNFKTAHAQTGFAKNMIEVLGLDVAELSADQLTDIDYSKFNLVVISAEEEKYSEVIDEIKKLPVMYKYIISKTDYGDEVISLYKGCHLFKAFKELSSVSGGL